jgi:hypothetical protein
MADLVPAPCASCSSASRHAVVDPNGLCANCRIDVDGELDALWNLALERVMR